MAPPKSSTTKPIQFRRKTNRFKTFYKKYVNFDFIKFLMSDAEAIPIVSILILLSELVINIFIVQRVKYTEIDWIAYMQECEGFLNGTTNYELLKGDTGPLVYPATFVYIYSALYFLTSQGRNVRLAQYIFIGIYLLQMWLVLRLYSKSRKVPPFVLILSAFTSYRIHSIFVLRLFNDPVAIVFLYASLNLFMDRRWTFGSILFSVAVGIKMNILLFAPALLLFYITNLGYMKSAIQLLVCGIVQLLLGAPFLLTYPWQYIKGSFDLGRVFEHKWTVNYRFLPREYFESSYFHLSLLILHLCLIGIFSKPIWKFFKNYARLRELQNQIMPQIKEYNQNLKAVKLKRNSSNVQSAEDEDQLSAEQENFVKSFEESLKKSIGPINTIKRPKEKPVENNLKEKKEASINFDQCTQLALLPFFFCNFIGITCARSLHYQFYVWYFHSLPYLLWCTNFSLGIKFLLLGLIELCWNTYPSTNFSSSLLHVCHLTILFGVGYYLFTAIKTPITAEKNTRKDK